MSVHDLRRRMNALQRATQRADSSTRYAADLERQLVSTVNAQNAQKRLTMTFLALNSAGHALLILLVAILRSSLAATIIAGALLSWNVLNTVLAIIARKLTR